MMRAFIICIAALLMAPAASYAEDGLPPAMAILGVKQFHDTEWGEYDTHGVLGMGLNYRMGEGSPFYFTSTLFQSFHAREDEEDEARDTTGNPNADQANKSDELGALSYEFGIGLRAAVSLWGIRPYVGGGATIVYGSYEQPGTPGCRGSALGGWYGYGLLIGKESSFTFGFDWRRTEATSRPDCAQGGRLEVGGTTITLTFGVPFEDID